MRMRLILVMAVALAAVNACGGSDDRVASDPTPSVPSAAGPATSGSQSTAGAPTSSSSGDQTPDLQPQVVVEGLEVPWGIAFLPDGSALIAERDNATIQLLDPDGQIKQVGSVAGVVPTSEGGLLGLAVSPTYTQDHLVYAYLTTADDNRVVAMTYESGKLSAAAPIFTGIPAGEIHDGGRIAFGPDGMLYVTTGETGDGTLAQDPSSLGGKILRLEPDGSVPTDNPDPSSPVWTLGHRNVQGITWDDAGRLWSTEFGADQWDEVNLIEPGNNYGWPAVEGRSDQSQFTNPIVEWPTDEASPSGVAYLDGSLYVAALAGERLYRIRVNGRTLGEPQALYEGDYGRLRTVVVTPDGTLWFTTSNRDGRGDPAGTDDRIFEIRP